MPTNPLHLRPEEIECHDFLRFYAKLKQRLAQPVFCFQVGANDGQVNDPVHGYFRDYGWSGLLVEPLVDVFENSLRATYANNPRVILENVALAPTEGELPFYRVSISRSRWATGLSGFRRDNLEAHIANGYIQRRALSEGAALPQDPMDLIETTHVRTTTVANLLSKHGITHFDVLCIDTEGFDYEILKLVDFDRFHPEVVLFESKNLTDADYAAAQLLLKAQGYKLYWNRGDTLATCIEFPQLERAKSLARKQLRQLKRSLRERVTA